MPPLFSSMTISGEPSGSISSSIGTTTQPKKRKGLLGRPSFFSRPSATSTTSSTSTTFIPLQATRSVSDPLTHKPRFPDIPNAAADTKSVAIATFLSSVPPSEGVDIEKEEEELKVALLPSALSKTSLGPSSGKKLALGPTPSNSLGGISASTSRNTVLPASHPILSSSGSTFLPPSTSLGPGNDLPTLASAIKLPSPARPDAASSNVVEGDATGVDSIITRKPVPSLSTNSNTGMPALPRSTSGTSIFGSKRLKRIASRASGILLDDQEKKETSKVPENTKQVHGTSLGRRISRRLSIDGIRPIFSGSTKRRSVVGQERKLDIQRWVDGTQSGGPPMTTPVMDEPADDPPHKDNKDGKKERLALPGLRSWRSKFSSKSQPNSSVPTRPKCKASEMSQAESVKSKRDSWVDVGSVRSDLSGYGLAQGSRRGDQASARGLFGALKRMENGGDGSPAVSAVDVPAESQADVEITSMHASPIIPDQSIGSAANPSPLEISARRSVLLDTLLARPEDDSIETNSGIRNTPGIPASYSAQVFQNLMSPAVDDKSLLEPCRSPLPTPGPAVASAVAEAAPHIGPGLTSSRSAPDIDGREETEVEELLPDETLPSDKPDLGQIDQSLQAVIQSEIDASEVEKKPLCSSISQPSLPAGESGFSFHTAQSAPSDPDITQSALPRSRSKSVRDLSTSASSLIERTEREQGEGWWSAPRDKRASMGTKSSFVPRSPTPLRSSIDGRRADGRRQSSPALMSDNRRPISVLAHRANIVSVSPAASPRRSILRPSRLQFADAEDDSPIIGDGEDTPTRPASRRSFKDLPPVSPVSTRRHSVFSTSFRGSGSPIAPPPTTAEMRLQNEIDQLRQTHSSELQVVLSALSAAQNQNWELRESIARLNRMIGEEMESRDRERDRCIRLERELKAVKGWKPTPVEFGPELSSERVLALSADNESTGTMGRYADLPEERVYDFQLSADSRKRRGNKEADEFGRLKGSSRGRA